MQTERKLPLSFWLPVSVAAAFVMLWGLTSWHEFESRSAGQLQSSKIATSRDLALLQMNLQDAYQAGDDERASVALRRRTKLAGYEEVVVIDPAGRIRNSSQPEWEGRTATEVLALFDPTLLAAAQKDHLPKSILGPQKQRLISYHPFSRVSNNPLTPRESLGTIFALYRLPYNAKDLWLQALRPNTSTGLFLLLALAILIGLLIRYVAQPADQLVSYTQAIASGEMTTIPEVEGHGKFAQVGRALVQMSNKLSGQHLQQLQVEHDLRHREELLQEAQQIARIGHYNLDVESQKWTSSSELNRIFGIDEDYERTIQSWLNLIHPGDKDSLAKYLQCEVLEQLKPFDREYRVIDQRTGEMKWVHGEGRLKLNSAGVPTRMFGTIQDITTNRRLLQAQKMETVGQLTGGIAHDFNNILCIILGNVDLLKRELKGDPKMLARVQTIGKSAQRAADLTKQMIGFSRGQATTIHPTNINAVIEAMHNLILRTLTPKITVVMHLQEDLWVSAIDPADFEDALLNLIINARDAMAQNGQLSIETCNFREASAGPSTSETGEFVQLLVRDNGVGIAYDAQEHIFEPFFTTKDTGKGTGLGLANVYGFVQRSGGNIHCESNPGEGTTLTMRLPRCLDTVANPRNLEHAEDFVPRGTETLLVVDDETDLVEIAAQSLRSLGYRVITASDGAEALQALQRHSDIDLLFSDVVMPGDLNGYQLAAQAKAQFPNLRVLMASGHAEDAVNQSHQHTMHMELLRKPYSQRNLAFQVRAALDGPADLAVGVAVLDDDHQLLMQLVSHGMHLADTDDGRAKAGFILRELHAYSKSHFEREEVVMAACNYPELANHRQVHQMLLRQLERMLTDYEQGQLRTADVTGFLGSWWDDHVRILDRAMVPYFVGKDALIEQALERYFRSKSAENSA